MVTGLPPQFSKVHRAFEFPSARRAADNPGRGNVGERQAAVDRVGLAEGRAVGLRDLAFYIGSGGNPQHRIGTKQGLVGGVGGLALSRDADPQFVANPGRTASTKCITIEAADGWGIFVANDQHRYVAARAGFANGTTGGDSRSQWAQQSNAALEIVDVVVFLGPQLARLDHQPGIAVADFDAQAFRPHGQILTFQEVE